MWFLDTRKNRRKKPSSPQFSEWVDAQHSFFLSKKSFISKKNLEVQPPFFIGWFLNHHYFSRGLSSSKRNHLFQNGGWLPGKTCPELKNTKTTWSACEKPPCDSLRPVLAVCSTPESHDFSTGLGILTGLPSTNGTWNQGMSRVGGFEKTLEVKLLPFP